MFLQTFHNTFFKKMHNDVSQNETIPNDIFQSTIWYKTQLDLAKQIKKQDTSQNTRHLTKYFTKHNCIVNNMMWHNTTI